MFSFPSKLKFDDKQQLHKALDYGAENHQTQSVGQVNFFEVNPLNVEILCILEVRPEVVNILVTRDKVFFLPGFSFITIHKSQECRGRGRAFLKLLTTTFSRFTDSQTLAARLLQKAYLCTQPAAGLEPGTFGFREQQTLKTMYYIGKVFI